MSPRLSAIPTSRTQGHLALAAATLEQQDHPQSSLSVEQALASAPLGPLEKYKAIQKFLSEWKTTPDGTYGSSRSLTSADLAQETLQLKAPSPDLDPYHTPDPNDDSGLRIFAEAVQVGALPQLRQLTLDFNNDTGVDVLAKAIASGALTQLTSLDLSYNRIGKVRAWLRPDIVPRARDAWRIGPRSVISSSHP